MKISDHLFVEEENVCSCHKDDIKKARLSSRVIINVLNEKYGWMICHYFYYLSLWSLFSFIIFLQVFNTKKQTVDVNSLLMWFVSGSIDLV